MPERIALFHHFAGPFFGGGLHGRFGAGEAQIDFAIYPGSAGDGFGFLGAAVHVVNDIVQSHVLYQGHGHGRFGHDFQADFGDGAQGAHGAGLQPGGVVAGHVFHYLAAEAQMLALAVEQADTQHLIPYRAGPGPRRAGKVARQGAAERGAITKPGRFEVQALAFFGQGGFDFRQRGTSTGGQYKFHRVVFNDSGVFTQLQGAGICIGFAAHKGLGATAFDVEFLACLAGLKNLVFKRLRNITHAQHPPCHACVVCVPGSGIPGRNAGRERPCQG